MKTIETIILGSLATFAPACFESSTAGCDPPSRDFSIDVELTEADVDRIVQDYGLADRQAIECEVACVETYRREEGWEASDIRSCTLSIAPMPGASSTDVVGSVECSGGAILYYCEGRRPAGHIELVTDAEGLVRHLAHSAYLEAAAVIAFEDLERQLRRWGAPADLIDRCVRAREDEREHARSVGALATRRGASPVAPTRAPRELSRLELALDNATEGCVNEAWAALRASWMAAHARDAELRSVYRGIAADEIRHAQLSWDLHAWLLATLAPHERAQVDAALRAALAALPGIAAAQATNAPAMLGLPGPHESFAIASHFRDQLGAQARPT